MLLRPNPPNLHRFASLVVLVVGLMLSSCQRPPSHAAKVTSRQEIPAQSQTPPLWGGLHSGNYDVGFRFLTVHDPTRLLHPVKTSATKTRFETKRARPVLAGLWYPSPKSNTAPPPLTYSRYLNWDIEDSNAGTIKQKLDRHCLAMLSEMTLGKPNFALDGEQRRRLDELLAMPVGARADVLHTPEPMPLVLYHHGAQGTFEESSIVMEYLASHGYVVASLVSIPMDGLSVGDGPSLDHQIRDAEVLLAALYRQPWVDRTRLALVGHSLGAQFSLIFAAEHGGVDAVVSLDTTWDYPNREKRLASSTWYQRYVKSAAEMSAAVLAFASNTATYEPFDAATGTDRHLVTMGDLHHDEYLSQWVAAARFANEKGKEDASRRASYLARYEQICETIRVFLDAYVRGRVDERAKLLQIPSKEQAALGISCQTKSAEATAPDVFDLRDRVVDDGAAPTERFCEELTRASGRGCPEGWTLEVAQGLLEEGRADLAVGLVERFLAKYEDEYDALLLLGRAHEEKGDKDRAREAYQRVVDKVPNVAKPLPELTIEEVMSLHRRQEALRGLERVGAKK